MMEKDNLKFYLIDEMFETVKIVKNFNDAAILDIAERINKIGRILITGEGSSRIFPAKNAIRKSLTRGARAFVVTEGSRQASQYNLSDFAVFLTSNSGKTKEVIALANHMTKMNHKQLYALTAYPDTPLGELCNSTYILKCGQEKSVAATKSVIEQALFYDLLLRFIDGEPADIDFTMLAELIDQTLRIPIDEYFVTSAAKANTIYFAGYNDGVAEELTLKTNEIVRKKSDYLEGTYAVHGIEEVMEIDDIVILIDPIEEEIAKFKEVLADGVGLKVFAIATHETLFPTLVVPQAGELNPYLFLCAGWNLLVNVGLSQNVNLDKPVRARKVGNEFVV